MWKQVQDALNQSATAFITRLASLLPGFVALILALLISLVLAWIVGAVVRRLLSSIRFDELLAHWGLSPAEEWSPRRSPTLLVSGAIAGAVVAAGILIGVAAFDSELTSELVRTIFAYVPNVIGAALVLLAGTIAARFLARSVLIGAVNLNLEYARLLSAGVKVLVNVLAVAMALEHLKIAVGIVELAFGILFGGIVFALALAVGLGSKDLVTKSLEREARKSAEAVEEPLRHL
jgi:Conserved TM helix